MPGQSRAAIQRLIGRSLVRLNGKPVKSHHPVHGGDTVELRIPEPEAPELQPQNIPLKVLYEDADLLVVDKPAGMVAHPAGGIVTGTLVNALLWHCRTLSGIGGVLKPGIVHRLDKGTSGCIAVAKNDAAHRALAEQFARREIRKEYLAILHGVLRRDEGLVEGLIARHPVDRTRMAVRRDRGKASSTGFTVLERFAGSTFVKVRLQTGRTHQIRVHMAHLGHPVLGDAVYGKRKAQVVGDLKIERPMLHAWRLGFRHPRTGADVGLEAPLPEDMERALQKLRSGER